MYVVPYIFGNTYYPSHNLSYVWYFYLAFTRRCGWLSLVITSILPVSSGFNYMCRVIVLNVEALDFDCLISYIVLVGLFVHSFCQVHVLFCLQLWRRLDGQQKVRHQIDLKFVDLIFRLPIKLLKQRKFAYMYLSSKFECFPIYIYTELFFSRRSIQS